jgi:hypothetical protein
MLAEAVLIASLLHRPLYLVDAVYNAGGVDATALVECESHFNAHAWRREIRGHSSWGLFQLDDEYHPQWRDNVLRHIAEGVLFLDDCKAKAPRLRYAVMLYNGSLAWGIEVERKRDYIVRWIWNHEGIGGGKV